MPVHRHFHRCKTRSTLEESTDVCKLWLLRLLVPLGAQRKFINRHDFESDKLAQVLGLGSWIEDRSESESWDLTDE